MPGFPRDDDPLPVPPVRPDNDECCGGGCNPCIFDRYEEARERYEEALAAWRQRNAGRGESGRALPPSVQDCRVRLASCTSTSFHDGGAG